MKIFIKGKPAPFATNLEKEWKENLREQIQIKSLKDNNDRGIILKFYLNSFTHNGQPFDLDNLVEPVFSVLINEKGYFNGKRKNIEWWFASKILSQNEGVEIEISNESYISDNKKISLTNIAKNSDFIHILVKKLDLESEIGIDTIIDEMYVGPIPTSAKSPELPDWLISKGIKAIGKDDKVSIFLIFPYNLNIGHLITGKVKSTIDCLYPILGGKAGSPDDWKIDNLRVLKIENISSRLTF